MQIFKFLTETPAKDSMTSEQISIADNDEFQYTIVIKSLPGPCFWLSVWRKNLNKWGQQKIFEKELQVDVKIKFDPA